MAEENDEKLQYPPERIYQEAKRILITLLRDIR